MKKKHLISLMAGLPDDADLDFCLYQDRGDSTIPIIPEDIYFNGIDFSTDDNGNICNIKINLLQN